MNASRYIVVGELMDVWTFVGLFDHWVDANNKRNKLAESPMWANLRILEVVEKTG